MSPKTHPALIVLLCMFFLVIPLVSCSSPSTKTGFAEQAGPSESSEESNGATDSDASSKNEGEEVSYEDVPSDAFISAEDLRSKIDAGEDVCIVDIRSRNDFGITYISGSLNIPAGRQLAMRLDEIPTDKLVVIIALENERTAEARATLLEAGFNPDLVKVADGGIDRWDGLGYPTATKSSRKC